MFDIKTIHRAHFIGIGGIHVSAVAKLLMHHGIQVTGSEIAPSEMTNELSEKGCLVSLSQEAKNIPEEVDVVIFSSAVPPTNPERVETDRRSLPSFNSHAFLGEWYKGFDQMVIAGTHGKSTTTSMVGMCLVEAGLDPSIVVGTKVSTLEQGNIRFGTSNLVVLEGDEYDRHFLSFFPRYLLINSVELDHVDQYPNLDAIYDVFGKLIGQMQEGGVIIADGDEANIQELLRREAKNIQERHLQVRLFGRKDENVYRLVSRKVKDGRQSFEVLHPDQSVHTYQLSIPGEINALNAVGCIALCEAISAPREKIVLGLERFPGVWRRCEKIAERDGIVVLSDYGHHPTAVAKTVEAVKEFYPGHRLILCFQPHHRNRTRHLFLDFVGSFDRADELLLSEIYDVAGRDEAEDEAVSSQDLCDAIRHHDADRGIARSVTYAPNPTEALKILKEWVKPNDVVLVMGAGDIYKISFQLLP